VCRTLYFSFHVDFTSQIKLLTAAHGDIHTRQGSVFMTANAVRTDYLSLEQERRKSPRDSQQLRSNGPSSKPQAAQTTEGTQVAPGTSMVRNRGSLLTMEKGDRKARVETSLLDCRLCFRPLKPPVFQCNGGHSACGTCLVELPGGQCPMCKHGGGGFAPCLAMDGIVSSATIKCSHDGCQSHVTYHEHDDHHSACPHAPCFCTEPGCSFAGPPPALLGHLATLHSWPVHKIEYGKVLWLQVPVSEPRRLLLAEDGGVFLLVVGLLNAITVVSVVCIRASTSPSLQYPAMMWAYGPPDVAGVRCMVDTEAVTSSSKPRDVVAEKLPFVLLVPPTHVFGAGASKELSLEIRVNKM
uniref:RING-type E3 ubiquitin transferase n=1 Tax=Aegilops tauschii subsp. strangulata TaxID=200361 RepID=A0A452ZJ12_AEGTS